MNHRAAYHQSYYRKHREAILARVAEYRKAHPDCNNNWFAAHSNYRTEWLKAHLGYMTEWRKIHPGYMAEWSKANLARRRAYAADYRKANPHQFREYDAERRARLYGATIEKVERTVVYDRDKGFCHICGRAVFHDNWHLDHVIPLSKGGEHSYRNVAVSHPGCNQRKAAS